MPLLPLMEDMFKENLEKTYNNNNIIAVNTAVGGTTSELGVQTMTFQIHKRTLQARNR